AAVTATDVLHVGVLAVDQFVVGLPEGHAPDLLPGRLACAGELAGQPVVIAEKTGILLAERDDDSARQCRQIHNEARLEPVLRLPKYVRQDEAGPRVRLDAL